MAVGLISCGALKLDHPAPARDIYVGSQFVMTRRFIEQATDEWAILSSKHGLLLPDQIIDPYEMTLTGMPMSERIAWGQRTQRQILDRWGPHRYYLTTASKWYRLALKGLPHTCPFDALPDRRMGFQRRWLVANTQ